MATNEKFIRAKRDRVFRKQHYWRLRKDCLQRGVLFEDPEFPANSKSLFFSKVDNQIEWLRPKELCKVPKLVVEGVSAGDLVAGELGNTWFVAACASLAQHKKVWMKVIPYQREQEYEENSPYAGIFTFTFWRFGDWIDVVVDDRLPTRGGKLIFCHSKSRNEFWSALVEKAYAKLFGDYESMQYGSTADALVDFTGGVAESIQIPGMDLSGKKGTKFLEKLREDVENGDFVVCTIKSNNKKSTMSSPPSKKSSQASVPSDARRKVEPDLESEETVPIDSSLTESDSEVGDRSGNATAGGDPWGADLNQSGTGGNRPPVASQSNRTVVTMNGLVLGQGYVVTAVRDIHVKKSQQAPLGTSELRMIRLLDPWDGESWNGPWSNEAREWKRLAFTEWDKLGLTFKQAGEFWMSLDDFLYYFTHVDICHVVQTSFFTLQKSWAETNIFSAWTSKGRNGGGDYSSLSFLSNPQFVLDVAGETKVMVSLVQEDVRGREALLGKLHTIGFCIMKVEENRRFRVHIPGERVVTAEFTDARSAFCLSGLTRGRYVLVPCTQQPGRDGEFVLRVYSETRVNPRELRFESPKTACCGCMNNYVLVTSITVRRCEGLVLPTGQTGHINPYVVISCEGEKVQSESRSNNACPVFNISATFYRTKPTAAITITVISQNVLFPTYLGEARCWEPGPEHGEVQVLDLYGFKKEKDTIMPGKVIIFIRSSEDLSQL